MTADQQVGFFLMEELPDTQVAMFDANDRQLRIWDLQASKGGNVTIFHYLILSSMDYFFIFA